MDDVDKDEPGGATSEQTMADLEEVALRRAAALGQPVVVAGFSSSGRAKVLDYEGPLELHEGELVDAGDVTVWPSPPPRRLPD
jgi:hypothetical protein